MKIAIVHDWLTNMGGAEKIIEVFHEIFPDAPIYTTVFDSEKMSNTIKKMRVHSSFIQKLPFAKTKYQKYLPLFPVAFEQFDLTDYDVVLSSSTACAKGVLTRPNTLHICYCNTPMRYAWEFYHDYLQKEKLGWLSKNAIPLLMNYLRMWDVLSSNRVDYFIANSHNVAKRIYKHYRRDSTVIHPPVDTDYYQMGDEDKDFFLIVSRLVSYKRVDLAIRVFNKLRLPLVIIGDGPEKNRLEQMAGPKITFLGRQPDKVVREYYAQCRAFIFPGEEDFGITPLEAQASGRPVIAYGRGGALETVRNEKTGLFFMEQNENALVEAVEKFAKIKFNKNIIRSHALTFSREIFKKRISEFILTKYQEHIKLMEGI